MVTHLFLDFDGVLHAHDAHFAIEDAGAAGHEELWAAGLFVHRHRLADLLLDFRALKVVVHSSWRLTYPLQKIRAVLGPLAQRISDVTPRELDREQSILAYMQNHRLGPDHVLVLDDQPGTFLRLRDRVLGCDPLKGLGCPLTMAALRESLTDQGAAVGQVIRTGATRP